LRDGISLSKLPRTVASEVYFSLDSPDARSAGTVAVGNPVAANAFRRLFEHSLTSLCVRKMNGLDTRTALEAPPLVVLVSEFASAIVCC